MITKTNPCPLCDAHGYVESWDSSILDALSCAYQQWLEVHGLPQRSMDEFSTLEWSNMSHDEQRTLSGFRILWEQLEEEARK